MPKKTDPLSIEEMTEAAETFFPLFNVIRDRMPAGSTTEDTLKVMKTVAELGHKNRADKKEEDRALKFGFNRDSETGEITITKEEVYA